MRKLTLLFTAPGAYFASDKPLTKDEVAMQTGVDPASLVEANPPGVVHVLDAAATPIAPPPPEDRSADRPHQKAFERRPTTARDVPLGAARRGSRYPGRTVSQAPVHGKTDPSPVPGPNPALERKA